MPTKEVFEWLRPRFFPHMWCPGCGHGIIMNSLLRAFVDLKLDPTQTVLASGIGCSSRMPGYINACTLHTTHGRSLAYATGIKMVKPQLTVIDVMGDGDCSAIGGNHFIHACRRNIDITAVVMNNNIYGMTGGQMSPTTPIGAIAKTAPYGVMDPSFDICKLAAGAGATYVARTCVANPKDVEKTIVEAVKHHGFSVVEVVGFCHTQYGRYNKLRTPISNIEYLKGRLVPVKKAAEMTEEELSGKIVTGQFVNTDRPEYTDQYKALLERVKGVK
jgi:2-oxoglutarate ferredoxin oxidoreductase subunit beta